MRLLMLVALVGCGENGEEVGSAASVSVMERIATCEEAEAGVTIEGISRTLVTVYGCDGEGVCDIEGGLSSATVFLEDSPSQGFSADTVLAYCSSDFITEVRIRWLAIE